MRRKLIVSIWVLLHTFCCVIAQNVEKKKISQDELLEMFQQSDNIWATFTYDVWRELDKSDLSRNKKLLPYFLKMLDYDEYMKISIERIVNGAEYHDGDIILFLEKRNKEYLKDTILSTPDLHKAYLDSAKVDYYKRLQRAYSEDGLHMPSSVIELFCYLKSPDAYRILYHMWENGVKYKGVHQILRNYLDPDVMKEYGELVTNCDAKREWVSRDEDLDCSDMESLYFSCRRLWGYGVYSIDWWLEMLRCKKKYYVGLEYLGEGRIEEIPCPFNVAILRIYRKKINSRYVDDLMEKLYACPRCIKEKRPIDKDRLFDYCNIHPRFGDEDRPVYKMSYKKLQEISDDIADHADEIAKAIQPYRDEIEKEDSKWRDSLNYFNKKGTYKPRTNP